MNPKSQNRSDRQYDQSTDKTKSGGKDQMQQGGQQDGKTVKPDAGVGQHSQR